MKVRFALPRLEPESFQEAELGRSWRGRRGVEALAEGWLYFVVLGWVENSG